MPILLLLADPAEYIPCSTENMLVDRDYLEHWLNHFEHHIETVLALAIDNYGPSAKPRADACRADFVGTLHAVRKNPGVLAVKGRLDLLIMDIMRQEKLIAHGIPDPFE